MKTSIQVELEHIYGECQVIVSADCEMGGEDDYHRAVASDMARLLNTVLDAIAEERAARMASDERRGRIVAAGDR